MINAAMKCLVIFSFAFICFPGDFALARQVTGIVLTEGGVPAPRAAVRMRAARIQTVTDAKGMFTLENTPAGNITVSAWKEGYLIAGTETAENSGNAVIHLHPIPFADTKDYQWVSPEPPTLMEKISIGIGRAFSFMTGNKKQRSRFENNCSNCHENTTVPEWRASAHSMSARNPLLLDMYNGTDAKGNNGIYPGYRLDFPGSAGNCATCHAPVAAMADPWNTDLNNIKGAAREGIPCDFCHKIKGTDIHGGGYPGVLSMRFNRPPPGEQLFYGPLDDVTAGPDTYSSLYTKSRFCAPCHSASFWGTPVYSEYDEWLKSPYPARGTECQDCHMAPGMKSVFIVPPGKGGVSRDPKTISTHNMPGSRDARFIASALKINVAAEKNKNGLTVDVTITNEKAGHHFPTGVPMRNLILLVAANDGGGKKLEFAGGPVVPDWGGIGSEINGDYAGLPGKGFAKILGDAAAEYPGKVNPNYRSPAPHWRQTRIVSDNRIPAGGSDSSRYLFKPKKSGCSTVKVKLIYRRAFKQWMDSKGWPLTDLELWSKEIALCE